MTTKAPRQREGKPFPGGKKYRKARAKLEARKLSAVAANKAGMRVPGSLK